MRFALTAAVKAYYGGVDHGSTVNIELSFTYTRSIPKVKVPGCPIMRPHFQLLLTLPHITVLVEVFHGECVSAPSRMFLERLSKNTSAVSQNDKLFCPC